MKCINKGLQDFVAFIDTFRLVRFTNQPGPSEILNILEFQGPTGPGILAPAGGFLTSLKRMFAPLTFPTVIIIIRKMFVPPSVCKKCLSPGDKQFVCPPPTCVWEMFVPRGQTICLSPGDKQFVCPPPTCVWEMFVPRGTNKLFVPRGQTKTWHTDGQT